MKKEIKEKILIVSAMGIVAAGIIAGTATDDRKRPLSLDEAYAELRTLKEAGKEIRKEKGKIELEGYENDLKSLEKLRKTRKSHE